MDEYEEFWNFLGSWFPDADIEGVDSDEEVVRNFLATGNTEKINTVRTQCGQVMAMDALPIEKITTEANRYFSDERECRAWLKEIASVLNEGC